MSSKDKIRVYAERLTFGNSPDIDEAKKRLKDYVKYLHVQTSYDGPLVSQVLETMSLWSTNNPQSTESVAIELLNLKFVAVIERVVDVLHGEQHRILWKGKREVLRNYKTCIDLLHNYADVEKFARAMVDTKLITQVAANLKCQQFIGNRDNPMVESLLQSCTGILYNVIHNCPDARNSFRKQKIDEIASTFLKDDAIGIRLDAIFILGYIIDEKEATKLKDNDCISFLNRLITKALSAEDHRYSHGSITYSAEELLFGLSRMALNDGNKQKIIKAGGLSMLVNAMVSGNVKEQEGAAKTVYLLSFEPTTEQVKKNKECLQTLHNLARTANKKISKGARGAIFQLNQSYDKKEHSQKSTAGKHLFISYHWADQDVIWPLSKMLKKQGFLVWIYTDDMKGSILQAMAVAVENAWAVVTCMSQKYKESPGCRTEAEYAYRRKTPIIPILLQRHYKPDGWLEMLLGTKLYVDFTEWDLGTACDKLVTQITEYLPGHSNKDDGTKKSSTAKKLSVPPLQQSSHSGHPRVYQAESWTNGKVKEWILASDLKSALNDKLIKFLNSMDGERLVGICKMEKRAPETVMQMLIKEHNADLIQIERLIRAFNELP